MRIERADHPAEREDALAIRQAVFVGEQGVPPDRELDEHEESATHFVAYDDGRVVGTARLREYDDDARDGTDPDGGSHGTDTAATSRVGKVERVAVLPEFRGRGVGRELMAGVEDAASADGFGELVLDSQVDAVPFYERLGYATEGEEFEDAGIPHLRMRKRL